MRIQQDDFENHRPAHDSIPFQDDPDDQESTEEPFERSYDLTCLPHSAESVLEALDTMSRRIGDLARELKCLGYFDEDDDGPTAA